MNNKGQIAKSHTDKMMEQSRITQNRRIKYEQDKNIRFKRSIVDFNEFDAGTSKHEIGDPNLNELKINAFPDTERTRGEKRDIDSSIFGIAANERSPITDFENSGTRNRKHRHGKHTGKIIRISQFPHTERLMAPGIDDTGDSLSDSHSVEKKRHSKFKISKHGKKKKRKSKKRKRKYST